MLQLIHEVEGSSENGTQHEGMKKILDEFQDVFEEPVGLPPTRNCDHQINLKDVSQ